MKITNISCFDKITDWRKVSSYTDMVSIKATQGHSYINNNYLFTDPKFYSNILNAIDYSVPIGVYHYLTSKTINEAREEASYMLGVLEPFKKYNIQRVTCVYGITPCGYKIINEFCHRIQEADYPTYYYNDQVGVFNPCSISRSKDYTFQQFRKLEDVRGIKNKVCVNYEI